MTVTLYAYDRCGTCRKARKWLDARGVAYTAVPIVDDPPSRTELEALWHRSGLPLKKFFNTSGKKYREGGWSARLKAGVPESEQLDALAAEPMLLKRPILVSDDAVLVGFKDAAYAEVFGG